MELTTVFFYLFAALAIGFALLVVLLKNPVASAFSLVMTFLCFAAIFALMQAHLIAAMQVLVYTGAIMVLFIFVIMLLNADSPSLDLVRSHPLTRAVSVLGGIALLAMLVKVFRHAGTPPIQGGYTPEKIAELGGNTRVSAELMFNQYVLPFEVTSILLLGATVGAVAIAKRKLTGQSAEKAGAK